MTIKDYLKNEEPVFLKDEGYVTYLKSREKEIKEDLLVILTNKSDVTTENFLVNGYLGYLLAGHDMPAEGFVLDGMTYYSVFMTLADSIMLYLEKKYDLWCEQSK